MEDIYENIENVNLDSDINIFNKTLDYEKLYHELNVKYEKSVNDLSIMEDKYLRMNADFENIKRRLIKEKTDLVKINSEKIILDFLSVVDNFERVSILDDGIKIIYSVFKKILNDYGVVEIEYSKMFNSDEHEAISVMEIPDRESGEIIEVVEKGYSMNGKIIRYSKVVVVK